MIKLHISIFDIDKKIITFTKKTMKLHKDDKVALISPAGFLLDDTAVSDAVQLLKNWGLKPIIGKNAMNRNGYFAGTDKERLSDLQQALDNPEIRMIWALRGGYGTNRIIEKLDFSKYIQNPKIIAGYSDITVLHTKLTILKIPSFHIFMPVNIKENINEEILELTRRSIFGEQVNYQFKNSEYNRNFKNVEAEVVGGNLAILYSLLGTNIDINTDDKILFIEDVGEKLYQIDRMIISLKQSGKLSNLKGLLVGQFTNIPKNEPKFGKSFQKIILEHTKQYNYPIIFDVPIGHITQNYPLIFGQKLSVEKKDNIISFHQKLD